MYHHWRQKSAQNQGDDAVHLYCSSITEIIPAAVYLTNVFLLAKCTGLCTIAPRFCPTEIFIPFVGIPTNLVFKINFCTTRISQASTVYNTFLTIIPAWTGGTIIALQTVTLNENRQQFEFVSVYCFYAPLVPCLFQAVGLKGRYEGTRGIWHKERNHANYAERRVLTRRRNTTSKWVRMLNPLARDWVCQISMESATRQNGGDLNSWCLFPFRWEKEEKREDL